jgi:hypothetical protein
MRNHPPRCDKCLYWVRDEIMREDTHPNDVTGECHRRAPSPILNLYDIRNMLSGIACKLEVPEENWKDWQEGDAIAAFAQWPSTAAHNWCGEFQTKN